MNTARPLFVMGQGNVGGRHRAGPPFFKTKKLAVIGSNITSKAAPWHDPSWTIASHCSSRKNCGREPDWYFDLHRPECFTNQGKSWNPAYYDWLQHLQTPIFMQQAWPEIPMAVAYPLQRILSEFRPYFTNHVAYMIALAMTEDVRTVGVFGCEYQHGSEYSAQRGSLEYWLGRYEQWGGKVVLPHATNPKLQPLLEYPATLYGYGSHDDKGKLCGDYKSNPIVTVPTKEGVQHKELAVVAQDGSCAVPLAKPPNGVSVDWSKQRDRITLKSDEVHA